MTSYDYPIEHFELMSNLGRYLRSIHAQLLSSEYSCESFGSWWFTLRKDGKLFRVVYDGREFELRIETDPVDEIIHGIHSTRWKELLATRVEEPKPRGLQESIEELIRNGLSR